jgi:archaemetzincin
MRKLSTLFAALATATLVWSFTVPKKEDRKKAVGSLFHLSPDLKVAFEPGEDFQPIPKPGGFDWLATHEEEGQTFDQFLKSKPNRPGERGRKFIYLQPVGEFPEGSPKLETLKSYLEAYFHPMPVKLAKTLTLKPDSKIQTRGEQVNSTDLLNALQKRVPADAHVMMAVTMNDLYPGPGWNFVFGVARLKRRCGVFSFARYGIEEDQKLALLRAMKVISHETGHAFGIKHCIHFHCLMNGSNSLGETDRAPLHFCPACLRKIHWGLKFQPSERYQKLVDFLEKNDFKEEAKWFQMRAGKTKVGIK